MNKPTAPNRPNDRAGKYSSSVHDATAASHPACSTETLSSLAEQLRRDAVLDAEAYVSRSDTHQHGE